MQFLTIVPPQDIADSAYRQRQGRPQLISSISKLVADVLISIFIQLLFLIQVGTVVVWRGYPQHKN